ncbi:MAG: hypothetical protein AcusKO_29290 [Acuticoccus sp.]
MAQLLVPLIAVVPGLGAAGGGLTILGKLVVAGLGIALSIGAELLLSSSQKRPKPQDVKTVVRSSVIPRSRHYGRGRAGGSLALIHSKEGDLYQVVLFGQGPWDAIEGYVVDDEVVALNGSGYATGAPFNADSIEIHTRLGTDGQTAFSELTSALGFWTTDHRNRGIACGLIIGHAVDQERYSKVYPNKFPVLNVIYRGALVFDPRDDTTAWSENLALQLRDYLVHPDGARIDEGLIDEDLFSAAADVCDENVDVRDGDDLYPADAPNIVDSGSSGGWSGGTFTNTGTSSSAVRPTFTWNGVLEIAETYSLSMIVTGDWSAIKRIRLNGEIIWDDTSDYVETTYGGEPAIRIFATGVADGTSFQIQTDGRDGDFEFTVEEAGLFKVAQIKRYHGALSYKLDEEPREVIQRFLVAMDGRMFLTPEGKIGIHAGKWITPTVTLTDDHIIDYNLEDGAGPHRRANEVTVKYTQVEATYAEATADPWRDDEAIAVDGIVRPLSPEIYEVQHHNHARRLAKLIEHRANPAWVGSVRTMLEGMECIDQRWITLQIPDMDIDGTFEVMGFRLDTSSMTVILSVQAFSEAAYDFNAAGEEGTAPAVPNGEGGGSAEIPSPASVTATSNARTVSEVTYTDTVYNSGSGTNDPTENSATVSALTMSVTVPTPPKASLRTQIQYSVGGSGDWEQLPVNPDSNKATTSPLARATTYIARARYKSPGGASDWTESNTVTMPS